jgi:hypothetical protein
VIEGDVRLAAYNAQANQKAADQQPSDGSALKLGGMPVNDATTAPPAPGTFVPAPNASSINQAATAPTQTVVATAKSSDQTPAAATTNTAENGKTTLQWRTP